MQKQTKLESWLESSTDTSIGFVGSFIITYCCVTLIKDELICTITTVGLCTIWSLVRKYTIRRYFEEKKHAASKAS